MTSEEGPCDSSVDAGPIYYTRVPPRTIGGCTSMDADSSDWVIVAKPKKRTTPSHELDVEALSYLVRCEHYIEFWLRGGDNATKIVMAFYALCRISGKSMDHNRACFECGSIGPLVFACLECIYLACRGEHLDEHMKKTNHSIALDMLNFKVICMTCRESDATNSADTAAAFAAAAAVKNDMDDENMFGCQIREADCTPRTHTGFDPYEYPTRETIKKIMAYLERVL